MMTADAAIARFSFDAATEDDIFKHLITLPSAPAESFHNYHASAPFACAIRLLQYQKDSVVNLSGFTKALGDAELC